MSTNTQEIRVALADDHSLLREALAGLINKFDGFRVIYSAGNGKDLISQIKQGVAPEVTILDLNMPIMGGYETALWLQKNRPETLILMLTMYDSDIALIRLLQAGVRGFLKKDCHPSELRFAIRSVVQSGFYYSHDAAGRMANLFRKNEDDTLALEKAMLSEMEIRFLKLVCTDHTYKEIAEMMHLNPRAVDNLRDVLFEKLSVKSRIGLALFAIRHGLVTI